MNKKATRDFLISQPNNECFELKLKTIVLEIYKLHDTYDIRNIEYFVQDKTINEIMNIIIDIDFKSRKGLCYSL